VQPTKSYPSALWQARLRQLARRQLLVREHGRQRFRRLSSTGQPPHASLVAVHRGSDGLGYAGLAKHLLAALIAHLARPPRRENRGRHPDMHGKIVERARAYVHDHLAEPISIEELAASRRTLFRAFADILDDTPQNYVRRLRLHRIRHDLASDAEKACTIALVANQWGIGDLGRMSGWYRELFGERPRDTVADVRAAPGKLARTT
jgi:transcriptional regulator GlxA family with amidase domain